MKIERNGIIIYIDDNSPEALKIKEGYLYNYVGGKIVIGKKPTIGELVDRAKTIDELKIILKQLLITK